MQFQHCCTYKCQQLHRLPSRRNLHFHLCFGGQGGDVGPVPCSLCQLRNARGSVLRPFTFLGKGKNLPKWRVYFLDLKKQEKLETWMRASPVYRAWGTVDMSVKTLFRDVIVSECIWKHSLCIWAVCDAYWTSMSILDFASHISDVCEAFYTIVSMWDTPALWGQCLRILLWPLDIWSGSLLCDLYIVRLSADVWLR